MTLEEAIKHCEEIACNDTECAIEHKQLAEWLKELQLYKSLPSNLEKAASQYAKFYTENENGNGGDDWEDDIKITFKAGAKWMAKRYENFI